MISILPHTPPAEAQHSALSERILAAADRHPDPWPFPEEIVALLAVELDATQQADVQEFVGRCDALRAAEAELTDPDAWSPYPDDPDAWSPYPDDPDAWEAMADRYALLARTLTREGEERRQGMRLVLDAEESYMRRRQTQAAADAAEQAAEAAAQRPAGTSPIEHVNATMWTPQVVDLLVRHGCTELYRTTHEGREVVHLARPGITDHEGLTVGYVNEGVTRVFTDGWAALPRGRGYDPAAVVAHLEHDGNYTALARANPAPRPEPTNGFQRPESWGEAHVAERLADDLRGHYRWAKALGWLRWDGRRWAPDVSEQVHERTRQWVLAYGRALFDSGATPDDMKAVAGYRSAGRQAAIVTMCRRMDGIATDVEALDDHPGLLNVRNGTVDLRSGELLPHDPDRLITKLANVDYDPAAHHRDADAVLDALTEDTRPWVQRLFGYAATGEATEDVVAVLDGAGSNGKTTLLKAVAAALGDYARPIARELVLHTARDEHPTAYAELYRTRLATLEELPEDGYLRPEQVKALSGGGIVRARYMHKDAWSFDLSHTLVIATNHRPVLNTVEHAVWRRLRLVPFTRRYAGSGDAALPGDTRKDTSLRNRVTRDPAVRSAILAWIITGAREWYASGLTDSSEITEATNAWRRTEDRLADFIEECLVLGGNGDAVSASRLYGAYSTWCSTNGIRPLGATKFPQQFLRHPTISEHSVERLHTRAGKLYEGVRVTGALGGPVTGMAA